MNRIIKNIIAFSIKNKFFIFFLIAIFLVIGVYTFVTMPIEAFPDITNTEITIITQLVACAEKRSGNRNDLLQFR